MWKESYRLGIESIDMQHQKLFRMTEELLKAIEEKKEPGIFQNAIGFLKEYVVVHFRDEEVYQASIQYDGMEEHIRQHRGFTKTVLSLEKKLEQSSYDITVVKELAGTLTAWLIYHVADADQKIAGKNPEQADNLAGSYLDSFGDSIRQVLEKMAGQDSMSIDTNKNFINRIEEEVVVSVAVTGDFHGSAVFGFSKEFALKMFEAMTFMVTEEVDELVCSALAEISNIICGNMAILLAKKGVEIDIKAPVFSTEAYIGETETEGMRVVTNLGGLEIAIVKNA